MPFKMLLTVSPTFVSMAVPPHSEDRWILPRYGRRFHDEIRGSRLVILDGLGHVPMEEDPARSVAPVVDFLAGR